jgi:hypothetical protein
LHTADELVFAEADEFAVTAAAAAVA